MAKTKRGGENVSGIGSAKSSAISSGGMLRNQRAWRRKQCGMARSGGSGISAWRRQNNGASAAKTAQRNGASQ
jgi:hypothetical protein